MKNFKLYKKFNINSSKRDIIKYLIIFLFIYLSFSNFFILEINYGNKHDRIKDEQVELFEWMSEHIPPERNFLIERDYIIRVGISSMVNGRHYFVDRIFDSDNNIIENVAELDELIYEKIKYLLITKEFLEESSDLTFFIENYLIPNFYNKSIYRSHNYRLYYAPYFD